MDFHQLITEPQYLDWAIDSTNEKLNTDKGVWCLLGSRFATRGPPQHSTRCHRNQACCEDNKTATMAMTGGVTRKPGSPGSSSKHDTCALKVKNIHRLNARYWTWAQRVLCLWVGCLQSSGWPLQLFYWRAERQIQHGRSLTWHVWCKILADCIHVLLGFRANPPRICEKGPCWTFLRFLAVTLLLFSTCQKNFISPNFSNPGGHQCRVCKALEW